MPSAERRPSWPPRIYSGRWPIANIWKSFSFCTTKFQEAGIQAYRTAFDILRKTAAFYESTRERLDGPLGEASWRARAHFARRYGIDRDLYREAVGRQMAYLDQIIADDSTNFRKKLKRLDLEAIERARLTAK